MTDAELITMRDLMTHRGPDDAGAFREGSVGLAHRRLRVIDLSSGHQPMANEAGTVHVVFNGEIYNYRALRQFLEGHGVRLRTQSDTETILGLYDLFGEACVERLHGMFAFVLWDAQRRRLLAARDRLGIKPLYVIERGATIAFASEIKALLSLPEAGRAVAEEAILEYLVFRDLAGTRTMFSHVHRVAPGEAWLVDDRGEVRRWRYWQAPAAAAAPSGRSADDWADELDEALGRSVGEHMISDVPLGTFNSGGVDSSLVTAYAARRTAARLNTYSVGFDDPRYDERRYAEIVAQRFGTDHHTLLVTGQEYAAWLPRAIWHHDEPLNHPHCVHLALLSRLARRKVTVVLTGEGSDELFAGYPRYRLPHLLDGLARVTPWMGPALRLGARLAPRRTSLRIRSVLNGDGGFHVGRLAAFVDDALARRVLASRTARGEARMEEASAAPPGLLAHALAFDQRIYLQSLLNRMDKMSMAASLEGRVPFLDHRVVELAARVPDAFKIRGRNTKFLVKHLARRYLPTAIVDRRKAGFAVPVASWLRPGGPLDPYVDLLGERRTLERGFLDPRALATIIQEHRAGTKDHGELVWGLVNLELWQRIMIDHSIRPEAPTGLSERPSPP